MAGIVSRCIFSAADNHASLSKALQWISSHTMTPVEADVCQSGLFACPEALGAAVSAAIDI